MWIRGILNGRLEITGSVARATPGPAITIGVFDIQDNLFGELRVSGSLQHNPGFDPDITVVGGIASGGAIAIDWDGYHPNDRWDPNAVITVGDSNDPNIVHYYQGNHPPDANDPNPVYEISCPKGDLNNDADPNGPSGLNPDFDDINPFVVALSGQAEYAAAYPGLSGAWQYHGDCNCDPNGLVDFDDVDAFILRLTDPNGYYAAFPGCELCPGQDNLGQSLPNDPASIAALFRTYVAPERLAGFAARVREFVQHHADTPRGRYWAAVLQRLE